MAKKEKKEKQKGGKSPTKITFMWIAILTAIVMFRATSVIIFIGLLPAIVAWVVDRRYEKFTAITVTIMNACGVFPWLLELWTNGNTIQYAVKIILNPYSWLVMYGAAMIGWLLTRSMPAVVGLTTNVQRDDRIRRLKKRQEKILEEWGPEIANPKSSVL